jgi:hypothetical protein
MGDDRHGALVAHDLALDLLAVGIAEALEVEADDAPVVDRAPSERDEAAVGCAHGEGGYPASSSSSAKVTSSIPSSAA